MQKHSTNNTETQYKQHRNAVQTTQKRSTNNTETQYKQYKTQYKQIVITLKKQKTAI
jgi:hypothetical protein